MKIKLQLGVGNHTFEKVNLVTISQKGRQFDKYKCPRCGCSAKRFGLSADIEVSGQKKFVQNCIEGKFIARATITESLDANKPAINYLDKTITLLCDVDAGGATDLKKGTVLKTVQAPMGEIKGTWVFSESIKSEVRIMPYEFEIKN